MSIVGTLAEDVQLGHLEEQIKSLSVGITYSLTKEIIEEKHIIILGKHPIKCILC